MATTINIDLGGLDDVTASLESTVGAVTTQLNTKLNPDQITEKLAGLDIGAQLACGKAAALDALNDVRDQIKAKLAEGLDALPDFSSLVADAKAKFDEVKGKIKAAIASLQQDLKSLMEKFGKEFVEFKNMLREKWGEAVSGLEDMLAKIPSLENILSGIEIPNLCKEFPNTNIDADGNVITNAPRAQTPVTNAEAAPDYNDDTVQPTSQPSETSPYAVSREDAVTAFRREVSLPVADLTQKYRDEFNTDLAFLDAEINNEANLKVQQTIRDYVSITGMDERQLFEEGIMSPDQVEYYQSVQSISTKRATQAEIMAKWQETITAHRNFLSGILNEGAWESAKSMFMDTDLENALSKDKAREIFNQIIELHEENRQAIIDYNYYNNNVIPSVSTTAQNGRLPASDLGTIGGGIQIRRDAAAQWNRMAAAAAADGITLSPTSGYRTYDHQLRLWTNALIKYGSAAAARRWVAPPGNSNHGWGLAVDEGVIYNNRSPSNPVYQWLTRNAGRFGFWQRMSWEPWHWEYRG